MRKMRWIALLMSVLMAACMTAQAVEVEKLDVDEALYGKPEVRWLNPSDYSSRVYYDLPYCGENSTEMEVLHLLLPDEGEGPYPVLVSVHGGAWGANNSNKKNQVTFTQAAAFAALKRGYAVACVDYTLKKKKTPVVFPLAMQEVRAAVRYLRSVAGEYNLDPDHFALIGESAGGQLVDMAATTGGEALYDNPELGNMEYSGDVQAVIAQYSGPRMAAAMTARLYDVEESAVTQEMLDECSAIAHVDAKDPPFYIEHGTADTTINYQDSVDFYNALVEAGVQNCELHLYEGMEHAVIWFQSEQCTTNFLNWLDGIFGR